MSVTKAQYKSELNAMAQDIFNVAMIDIIQEKEITNLWDIREELLSCDYIPDGASESVENHEFLISTEVLGYSDNPEYYATHDPEREALSVQECMWYDLCDELDSIVNTVFN